MPDQVKSPPQTREGLRALIEQVKKNKLRDLTCGIEGLTVRYTVCGEWPDWLDSGLYDAQGTIYVSDTLVRKDRWLADLTAFHEQTELNHQAAGRSHAYAHRRALLLELLAAKRHFGQPGQLRG